MKQAKASYAFNARSAVEISFDVGDVIVILEEDLSGWGKGRTKDYKEGYFPLAYVQVEELSESDSDDEDTNKNAQPLCTAMYDFVALSELQLSFSKGDVINITKKGKENDWWEGIVQHSQQKGLFPSNYVKLGDQHNNQIIQTPNQRADNPQPNNFKEHPQNGVEKKEGEQYKISEASGSEDHKKEEGSRSNFRIEDSFENEPSISSLTARNANQFSALSQNTSAHFSNLSTLDVSVPFELHTGNYPREFATLSPISPNLSALAYDPAEIARRRHSMNLSASPLSLSAFSGEYTRDFDALCLLYPFVPSSVSQNTPPPSQSLFTPTKISTTNQPVFISPSTDAPHPISQPIFIPSSHQPSQSRPQSAPQFFTHLTPSPQSSSQTSQSSTPPKSIVPKLPLTSSSPDRKERYSNRDQRERNPSGTSSQTTTHTGSIPNAPSSTNGAKTPGRTPNKYGAIKSPGARRDASTLVGSTSKRKVKLEGTFSMGKKPNSTITHSNSSPEQANDSNQASVETKPKDPQQAHLQQQNEVEYLKKLLQQEVELRTHLESVVHDAHGKMHSASQYIKDLKAELFQAHMDISQLRVTNRQLNEQLDKYQLVTRVTVATQTERDENIDKIRVLTEQVLELEANTDLLNEQIVILKNRPVERSPRNVDRSPRSADRSPRGYMSINEVDTEGLNRSGVRVDYAAVKQQFARVRECLLLEKDIKDRLIVEKTQAQEKLQKTEQHSKQIRRKLLTELQLKSDLNVRNQQIELQMQKLKEELAAYKHQN